MKRFDIVWIDQEEVEDPDGVYAYAADALAEIIELQRQLDAAHKALAAIRFAGNNTTEWATWAQRTAAWGMGPHKWPKQSEEAPE